jgi:hypothetical protein
MVRRLVRWIATLALFVVVIALVAWGAMALWFDGPQSRVLAGTMAGGFALVSILLAALSTVLERSRAWAVAGRWCRSVVDVNPSKQYARVDARRRSHGTRNF